MPDFLTTYHSRRGVQNSLNVFNLRPQHSGSIMQNLKSLDCIWEEGPSLNQGNYFQQSTYQQLRLVWGLLRFAKNVQNHRSCEASRKSDSVHNGIAGKRILPESPLHGRSSCDGKIDVVKCVTISKQWSSASVRPKFWKQRIRDPGQNWIGPIWLYCRMLHLPHKSAENSSKNYPRIADLASFDCHSLQTRAFTASWISWVCPILSVCLISTCCLKVIDIRVPTIRLGSEIHSCCLIAALPSIAC